MSPLDSITAYVIRHRRAGSSVVGMLSSLEGEVERALEPLSEGLVVLSTCHRFEVYIDGGRRGEVLEALSGVLPQEAMMHLEVFEGVDAVRHLMEVAAGLDSEIIGEHEVLGQVRKAWVKARSKGLTTPLLDQVFHRAVVAGRRVRSETGIAQGRVGYPEVAVDIASERLGGLDGSVVAVVGAGDAGRSILLSLCDRFKPSKVIVYNRSLEKAREAASICGGEAKPLKDLEGIPSVDVLFIAVSGYKVKREVLEKARIVVDISNPPAAEEAPHVIGFGEVTRVARERIENRRKWIPYARRIIEEELDVLVKLLERSRGDMAASVVMKYAHTLIEGEVEATLRNLQRGVDPREALETAFSSYARKVLHPLLAALRKASVNGRGELVDLVALEYARRLGRLEEAKIQA